MTASAIAKFYSVSDSELRYAMAATLLQGVDTALRQTNAELARHTRRKQELLKERERIMQSLACPVELAA